MLTYCQRERGAKESIGLSIDHLIGGQLVALSNYHARQLHELAPFCALITAIVVVGVILPAPRSAANWVTGSLSIVALHHHHLLFEHQALHVTTILAFSRVHTFHLLVP